MKTGYFVKWLYFSLFFFFFFFYLFSWSIADRGHINDAFSGNIVRNNDSSSNIQRSLRHRHSYQDLQPAPQRIKPFYHEVTHKVPDEEIDSPRDNPIVFPVESFGDSSESNRSDPDSPKSNEQSIPGSSQSGSDRLNPVIATESADIHL